MIIQYLGGVIMNILSTITSLILSFTTMLTAIFGIGGGAVNPENKKTYDNVILFIGDGMGLNHIEAAQSQYGIDVCFDELPVKGQSETDNYWGTTTDSAAGGTALATGIRTTNGYVGRSVKDPTGAFSEPMNLTELAISLGKSAGVVTTDKTTGATPGAFSAHALDRDYNEEISDDQLASDLTLIWGAKESYVTENMATENGFKYVDSVADIEALKQGERSFGQFNWDDFANVTNPEKTPTIAKMTEEAIDILDDDEDGFFLMVEGAHIDKYSHNKDIDNAIKQLDEFNKAVEYALDYAEKDGSTLIVITADHETGKVTYNESTGKYECRSGSHTDTNVGLFVSDRFAGFASGLAIENREVSIKIAYCLGAEKGSFPRDI